MKVLNSLWTQPQKCHCETVSYCLAGLEQCWEQAVTFSLTQKVFFCYWKCYVDADVQLFNLMHYDVVSTKRELWTISAWTVDFRESVGKHDIFIIIMLVSLHNTGRWWIQFKGLWTKSNLGLWLTNTLSEDDALICPLQHLCLCLNIQQLSSWICEILLQLGLSVSPFYKLRLDTGHVITGSL